MTADWPDDNPSAHRATAIYSQGVPLQRKPLNVSNATVSIPVATPVTLFANQPFDQPSFQLALEAQQSGAPAATPFARLRYLWRDVAAMLTMETDWTVVPFGSASPVAAIVTGPARMDQLSVITESLDPAAPLNLTYTITQHSQVYDLIRMQEVNNVAVAGYSRPGGVVQTGVIASAAPVVAATTAVQRLVPVWSGKAVLSVDNAANTATVRVRLLDPGLAVGATSIYGMSGNGILDEVFAAGGASAVQEVALPTGPVVLELFNTSATVAITPQVSLVRLDQ